MRPRPHLVSARFLQVLGSWGEENWDLGQPRYNRGKESYKIPPAFLEKRRRLLESQATTGGPSDRCSAVLRGAGRRRGAGCRL